MRSASSGKNVKKVKNESLTEARAEYIRSVARVHPASNTLQTTDRTVAATCVVSILIEFVLELCLIERPNSDSM